jgi:pantoate--beta-alanine ligase
MQTFTTVTALRSELDLRKREGKSIALVPTMGNLHTGHIKLFEAAVAAADFVVGSIFVNPLQFGANEDLDAYPRTLSEDKAKLEAVACDCLFAPSVTEIYPDSSEPQTVIRVPELARDFCGKSRPGHFEGVATVVNKLFKLVQPDQAFFGLKDYQQYLVIQNMVADLSLPIKIIGIATQREDSGLALSSRNHFLSETERKNAAQLYYSIRSVAEKISEGGRDYSQLEKLAKEECVAASIQPDYFSVCHATTLALATPYDKDLVILAAAYVGSTRLIDNSRILLP